MVVEVTNMETLVELLDSEQEISEENSFLEDEVPFLSEMEWKQKRAQIRELQLRGLLPMKYEFVYTEKKQL